MLIFAAPVEHGLDIVRASHPRRRRRPWLGVGVALLLGCGGSATKDTPPAKSEAKGAADDVVGAKPRAGGKAIDRPAEPGGITRAVEDARGLTEAQIDQGLRNAQPMFSACVGPVTGGKEGEQLEVTIDIDRATGSVTKVELEEGEESPSVWPCVRAALQKAEFEAVGTGTQTISRTVTL